MHRADPRSAAPSSPRRRGRRPSPPDDGSASLLFEDPDPGPRDLTPRCARVTIAPLPPRRQWQWKWPLRWYDVAALAVIAVALIVLLR